MFYTRSRNRITPRLENQTSTKFVKWNIKKKSQRHKEFSFLGVLDSNTEPVKGNHYSPHVRHSSQQYTCVNQVSLAQELPDESLESQRKKNEQILLDSYVSHKILF